MAKHTTRTLAHMAQQAHYQVLEAEQLRTNRWLLIVKDGNNLQHALLVQDRPLISAADVLDLSDIVRLRRLHGGILLALNGSFSPAAQRTHQELAEGHLRLCVTLPIASRNEQFEAKSVSATLTTH